MQGQADTPPTLQSVVQTRKKSTPLRKRARNRTMQRAVIHEEIPLAIMQSTVKLQTQSARDPVQFDRTSPQVKRFLQGPSTLTSSPPAFPRSYPTATVTPD